MDSTQVSSQATQMMDSIMQMPLVAELISISVTLGLASGGFFVVWRMINQPINFVKVQIRKNFTRHLTFHSHTSGYEKYIFWLSSNNDKMIFNRNFKISEFREWNDELGKRETVIRVVPGLGSTYFYNKTFGFMRITRNRVEANQTHVEVEELLFTFYGKNIHKVKAFAEEVNRQYEEAHAKKVSSTVYTSTGGSYSHEGNTKRVLPPISVDAQEIVADVGIFLDNEAFYRKKGIPYKRGYMMYGPPGTGKTSLVAYIANKFKIDVVTSNGMSGVPTGKDGPYILLIEDIDLTSLASKRKDLITSNSDVDTPADSVAGNTATPTTNEISIVPMMTGSELLRTFLNSIDGITETSGVIVMITSNKPDSLDPAMIRPGRIDVKKYLGNYTTQEQIQHFNRFYETDKVYDGALLEASCAEVQNICVTTPHDPDVAWSKIIANKDRRTSQSELPEGMINRRVA